MPGFTVEAPEGASPAAKQAMLRGIAEAIYDAYRIQDIRGWLREYSAHDLFQNKWTDAENAQPVCILEAPELASLDGERQMIQKIKSAIAAGYAGRARAEDIVVLINQYPPDCAS